MKRICTVVLVLISGIASAQNTLPVIPFGDRKADLYYWDTNWYDRYELLHPNEPVYPGIYSSFSHYPPKDMYIGRACVANTPILVKGIAGAVDIKQRTNSMITQTLDTTISGRVPEWFKLYDVNYNLLGEGRWDTVVPTYRMEFRSGTQTKTYDIYEGMFYKLTC